MDEQLKSKLSEFKTGIYSSRLNNTNNSYTLRSTSQNNVSRKQGIYSKFVSKANVSRNNDLTARDLSRNNNLTNYASNSFKKPGDLSRIQTNQVNGKRGNDSLLTSMRDPTRNDRNDSLHASMRDPTRNDSNYTSHRSEEVSRNSGRREHVNASLRKKSPILNLHDSSVRLQSPPQRSVAFHPQPIENNVSQRMDHSTRLQNPPQRLAAFQDPIENNVSKMMDLSTRLAMPHINLSPRVLLTDFRRGDQGALERDNDGFLLPGLPVQRIKTKVDKIEDLKEKSTLILNDFLDQISQLECYYFLSRSEKCLMDVISKSISTKIIGTNGIPQDKGTEIASWIQNSVRNEMGIDHNLGSMTASVIHEYPPSMATGSVARPMSYGWNAPPEPIAKTICILKDWTIIKGSGPIDVMISGDILDINTLAVIELNHVSSKIISADAIYVQTSCCVYHLKGTFQDRAGCIPQNVKKYFSDGKFPREWKEVIKLWGVLNVNQANHLPEQNGTYSRVPYEDRIHIDRIRRQAEIERDIDRLAMERGEEVSHSRMVVGSPPGQRQVKELVERYLREKEVAAVEKERSMWKEELYRRAATAHGRRMDEEDEVPVRDTDGSDLESEQNTRSRIDNNTSRYGRKRKSNARFENERRHKIPRVEIQQRMRTPKSSSRMSAIGLRTRSALRGRRLDSFLCTPKSSKATNKNQSRRHMLKSRPKTPMPGKVAGGKGRRIIQDDSVFNDSDLH